MLDPYEKDSVPGLKCLDVEADQCLCSHGHGDHCGLEWVRLKNSGDRESLSDRAAGELAR